jgi:hypothetical protein
MCWRRIEKTSWMDHARNEVLQRVKKRRYILQTMKRRNCNWIGHIFCRECLLKHVIWGKLEGRIEIIGRRGRRRKQVLDNLREKRGYCKLKDKALDHITLCGAHFERGYGPVVTETCRVRKCTYSLKP